MRRVIPVSLLALALSTSACSGLGGASDPANEPAVPASSAPAPVPADPSDPVDPASAQPTPTDPADPASAQPTPADPTDPTSGQPTPAGPPPGQPTPADPSAPTAGRDLGEPVASRTSASDGKKVTMQVYPVQRDGTVSHVNLALSSPVDEDDRVPVADLLSDENVSAIDEDGSAADGLQLVDGKNAKLYLVASDGQGQCLCSRGLEGVFLSNNLPILISATFAAPPADVSTVDVRVPNFGAVSGVPVQ